MSDAELRRTVIELERSLDAERARLDAVRRVAQRALTVVSGHVPALQGTADELGRALASNQGNNLAGLDRLSAQLSDAERSRGPNPATGLANNILGVVRRGLSGFDFLESEREALPAGVEGVEWAELEQTLTRLLAALYEKCESAMVEREELTEVVGEIWNRLEDVDHALSEDENRGHRARESVAELHAGISSDVRHIKGRVVELDDLASMREEVTHGLDRMVERVTTFREAQETELLAALNRNRLLRSKSRTLEGQVQALRSRLEQARNEAIQDKLTGLPNRAALEEYRERLPRELEASGTASVLIWDIDHFKAINDEYGHAAGDKVLRAVAEILAEHVREPDFIARFGGEEFVMILPVEPETAHGRANRIREAVSELVVRAGTTRVQVTISAGLARMEAGQRFETVFDAADHALLQAKKLGRNRVMRAPE